MTSGFRTEIRFRREGTKYLSSTETSYSRLKWVWSADLCFAITFFRVPISAFEEFLLLWLLFFKYISADGQNTDLLFVSLFRHRSELYTTSWMTAEIMDVILGAEKKDKGPERKGNAADTYKRNGKTISPVWSSGDNCADRQRRGMAYLCTPS